MGSPKKDVCACAVPPRYCSIAMSSTLDNDAYLSCWYGLLACEANGNCNRPCLPDPTLKTATITIIRTVRPKSVSQTYATTAQSYIASNLTRGKQRNSISFLLSSGDMRQNSFTRVAIVLYILKTFSRGAGWCQHCSQGHSALSGSSSSSHRTGHK